MDVVIVWIAPWFAIFMVDWVLRQASVTCPPNSSAPIRAASTTGNGGYFWPAIIAQVVGMYAALFLSALVATFHSVTPSRITTAEPDHLGRRGGQLRIRRGLLYLHGRRRRAWLLYWVLAARAVRAQADRQDRNPGDVVERVTSRSSPQRVRRTRRDERRE